jgi:hypothetical protein
VWIAEAISTISSADPCSQQYSIAPNSGRLKQCNSHW